MYKQLSNSRQVDSDQPLMAYQCPRCKRQRDASHCELFVREFVDGLLADPRVLRAWAAGDRSVDVHELQDEHAARVAEMEEAYEVGLSPRGLKAVEDRLLPEIEKLSSSIREASGDSVDTDAVLATGVHRLPEDTHAARALLLRLRVRLVCAESRRGRYFDYDSIEVRRAP